MQAPNLTYPPTATTPWQHQRDAMALAAEHPAYLFAHDMGAGKSKLGVDYCALQEAKRVLILCPKSVIAVWPKQFALHSGGKWEVLPLASGTVKQKTDTATKALRLAQAMGRQIAIVVNYESAWRGPLGPIRKKGRIVDQGLLLSTEWDVVILDESHRVKSPGGKASKFCAALRNRAKRRLCLTGTPMPHSPLDLYAQYRFLDPSIFGNNYHRFKMRYGVMGGFQGKQVIRFQRQDEMQEKMFSRAHRVSKHDVLDLPPTTHEQVTVELGPTARNIYNKLEREFVAEVEAGTVTASNALVKLLRLQQVTGGAVSTDEGKTQEVDTAKADALEDLFTDLPAEEPVVVFGRFHHDLTAIARTAAKCERTCGELSGRVNQLEQWQDGKFNVLAVQIRSGGLGVDCTRSAYCAYYSLGFSLGDYEQSLARLDRPGQTRPVTYYHILATSTVDEDVYAALRAKRKVVDSILEGGISGR